MDERLKILRSRDLAGSQDMMSRSPFYLLFSEFRVFFLYCFPLNMFLSFCDAIDILSSKNEAPVLFTQIWIILSKRKKKVAGITRALKRCRTHYWCWAAHQLLPIDRSNNSAKLTTRKSSTQHQKFITADFRSHHVTKMFLFWIKSQVFKSQVLINLNKSF